jgi:hypothetical protein
MEAGSRRPLVEVLGLKVTFTLQAEHSDLTDQEVDGLPNLKLYQPN